MLKPGSTVKPTHPRVMILAVLLWQTRVVNPNMPVSSFWALPKTTQPNECPVQYIGVVCKLTCSHHWRILLLHCIHSETSQCNKHTHTHTHTHTLYTYLHTYLFQNTCLEAVLITRIVLKINIIFIQLIFSIFIIDLNFGFKVCH